MVTKKLIDALPDTDQRSQIDLVEENGYEHNLEMVDSPLTKLMIRNL